MLIVIIRIILTRTNVKKKLLRLIFFDYHCEEAKPTKQFYFETLNKTVDGQEKIVLVGNVGS